MEIGILITQTDLKGLGMGLEKVWNGHSNDTNRFERAGDEFRKSLEWAF